MITNVHVFEENAVFPLQKAIVVPLSCKTKGEVAEPSLELSRLCKRV